MIRRLADVLVLCYHAVSRSWPAALSVTPDVLEAQLHRLVSRGYRGATFADALTAPPGTRVISVTFDDAYRSVAELAFPVLERLGVPGTVFVPTGFAGASEPMSWPGIDDWLGGPHEGELVPMSWEQLRRLQAAGWEIGSHTVSHPRLTRVDDEQLAAELRDSRLACEARTGERCTSIAYPYGDVDARVTAAARDAGYAFGAALPASFHRPRPLEWPRIGVYRADPGWRFALKVSRSVRVLRSWLRY
jgi:peptidoglycan/xylan/chitin deacetylase (PgdA/CDA1 family)